MESFPKFRNLDCCRGVDLPVICSERGCISDLPDVVRYEIAETVSNIGRAPWTPNLITADDPNVCRIAFACISSKRRPFIRFSDIFGNKLSLRKRQFVFLNREGVRIEERILICPLPSTHQVAHRFKCVLPYDGLARHTSWNVNGQRLVTHFDQDLLKGIILQNSSVITE